MKYLTLLFILALLSSCSTSTSSVVIETTPILAGPATIAINDVIYTVSSSVTGDTLIMTEIGPFPEAE